MKSVVLLGLLFTFAATCVHATYYTVGAGGAYAHIQDAIDAAITHAGDDEVRVHQGIYDESISVPATMTADKLTISGGWRDGYATREIDPQNTIIAPGANQRGGLLQPAGGHLELDDLEIYGALTDAPGAGLYIGPTGSAVVTVFDALFVENVVERVGTHAYGGAIYIVATGTGGVDVLSSEFRNNRVSVLSGTGAASGAAIEVSCSSTSTCTIADNLVRDNTAEASNEFVSGGAVSIYADTNATVQFDRNVIESVSVTASDAMPVQGRSLQFTLKHSAVVLARGDRVLGAAPAGPGTEVILSLSGQCVATFSDSLIARSPLRALTVSLHDSANAYLTNLTLADNAFGPYVTSTSTGQPFLSNSILTNTPGATELLPVAFTSNSIGAPLAFLAPSLYDYSLRKADPAITDAGADTPPGDQGSSLGVVDIADAARVQGAHVDIGAWESSDRIFADLFED